MPIHIQHVLLSLRPGGLENGVINVVNRLDRSRFRSSVCCLQQAGEFAGRIQGADVQVAAMGLRGGNDLRLPFKLARLFRETGTQIVHTRNAEAFYYGFLGAKLAGVPAVIHSEHGRTFDDRPIRFLVQRLFSRHTDAIFAVSAQLKRDLVRHVGIPAGRIQVLYNGVDLARFAPQRRPALRSMMGLADDELVVGSVGRLVPVKNYGLLLRAVRGLEGQRLSVVLVGDGPQRAELEALARELGIAGRVRFFGHSDNVADQLGAMDIFVLPSFSEGMSNTLLEAMAAGVTAVASNAGGNPELIENGKSGLLFESGDEQGLRECLRALLHNPDLRAQYGLAGRERMLREFSIQSMIERYERLYEAVITGGAGNRESVR